jgi:hypothetical protein
MSDDNASRHPTASIHSELVSYHLRGIMNGIIDSQGCVCIFLAVHFARAQFADLAEALEAGRIMASCIGDNLKLQREIPRPEAFWYLVVQRGRNCADSVYSTTKFEALRILCEVERLGERTCDVQTLDEAKEMVQSYDK